MSKTLSRIVIFIGSCAVCAAPVVAYSAGQPITCPAPVGAQMTLQLRHAPLPIRESLQKLAPDIVPVGKPFDATDVIVTGHSRRLLFIWRSNDRWIIATEHGGRGYNDPVFAFDMKFGSATATLVESRVAVPHNVCQIAEGLIREPEPVTP